MPKLLIERVRDAVAAGMPDGVTPRHIGKTLDMKSTRVAATLGHLMRHKIVRRSNIKTYVRPNVGEWLYFIAEEEAAPCKQDA